ncbi:MAG TPA: hypothetical protein VJ957_06525 [Longimicrobiales bacterium]|nr:hypothetical protein [Longimicrobiales bacterium]
MNESDPSAVGRRMIQVTVLGWLAMLGIDALLHAGILARMYTAPRPFLLPPEQAFRRIPLGYASFLVQAVLLTWLCWRLDIRRAVDGLRFGLLLGGVIWGSLTLGLASIATASTGLLIGWFVGQTVELGVAGAVVGAGLKAERLRRLSLAVLALVVGCLIITVVLQNIGLAPAARVNP